MFGFFKKKDWQARINSDTTITVKAGQNLLASGLEAGLNWPHDCRVGSCGTCRCHLKSGKIKALQDFGYVLTPEELEAGMILACQTALKSDVEIEVKLDEGEKAKLVELRGVVAQVKHLTYDIVEIVVRCDQGVPKHTVAGQYMELSYAGLSKPRNYSFAKAPQTGDKELSFYVRHVPGGEFTDWLFEEDRTNTPMTVKGPYGHFWLRRGNATMICIAGGSGMSAVKAVLEDACQQQAERDAVYAFGARTQKDLYCLEDMQQLKQQWNKHHRFEFIPVLSSEPEDSDWQGARGYVTDFLLEHYLKDGKLDTAQCEAYMCGPPPMIDAGIQLLTKSGVSDDNIFYDKFLDASTMPEGR